jgi:hypothetical protein
MNHAKRFVVHVRRGSQPLDQRDLWSLVYLPDQVAGIRLARLRITHAITFIGEQSHRKQRQATDLPATLSTHRQSKIH